MPSVAIDTNTSGAQELVPAPGARQHIRVQGVILVAAAGVSVRLYSGTSFDAAHGTGPMAFGTNGGVASAFADEGWFDCKAGERLTIELGGAVAVGGLLKYTILGPTG